MGEKKTFRVEIEEIRRYVVEVKAKSFEAAERKARKKFCEEDEQPYEIQTEFWEVEELVDEA